MTNDAEQLPFAERGEWKCPRCFGVEPWAWAASAQLGDESRAAILRACELVHRAKCTKPEVKRGGEACR